MNGVAVLTVTFCCIDVAGKSPVGKPSRTISAGWKSLSVGSLFSENSGGWLRESRIAVMGDGVGLSVEDSRNRSEAQSSDVA